MVLSEMNKSVEKVHLMELTGILDGKIDPDIINKQIEIKKQIYTPEFLEFLKSLDTGDNKRGALLFNDIIQTIIKIYPEGFSWNEVMNILTLLTIKIAGLDTDKFEDLIPSEL